MEEEPLGEIQQKTGKILTIVELLIDETIGIVFETSASDMYYGGVKEDFAGLKELKVNDSVYLEFFEYSNLRQVDIEVMRKIAATSVSGAPAA